MKAAFKWVEVSRQAEYQHHQRRQQRNQANEEIMEKVKEIRKMHPQLGTRKLQYKLRQKGLLCGRDRLFGLLKQHDLLIHRKAKVPRTTEAGTWRFANLLEGQEITAPNQAWVSDLTYLRTEQGFCYLALITDVHSRRIMGADLSVSLTADGVLRAFDQAVRKAGTPLPPGLIFHSDHGIQYTCHPFQAALRQQQCRSSMGAIGNCYENALAERMNGILKQEYGLEERFVALRQAALAVRQAIFLYNHDRPHLSLGYQTPQQVYQEGLMAYHSP